MSNLLREEQAFQMEVEREAARLIREGIAAPHQARSIATGTVLRRRRERATAGIQRKGEA